MSNKTKILFDISHTIHGHTGIQQDLRYTLEALVESEKYEIDLLLYDMVNNYSFITFDYEKNKNIFGEYVAQAKMLSYFFNTGDCSSLQGNSISKRIQRKLYERLLRKKTNFYLVPILKEYNETVLRKLLAFDISKKVMSKLLESTINVSNVSSEAIIRRMNEDSYTLPSINTEDYDIAVFIQEFPILISKKTKKVVRTYDLLQILTPDVVYMADYKSAYQHRSIHECIKQDAQFVTISNTVKKELDSLFQNKIKSKVIECVIADHFKRDKVNNELLFPRYGISEQVSRYILAVSTIEPRKNFFSAYTAFRLLKEKKEFRDLKFVIIGSKSWLTTNKIKPIFSDKDIVLVKDVLIQDMAKFYSNAELLLFVPFKEGFGLPPIEAQACGTLVVTSDIPVHRETQGTSSFYVNPYDVVDIARGMEEALKSTSDERLVKIKASKENAFKYQKSETLKKWLALIEDLK